MRTLLGFKKKRVVVGGWANTKENLQNVCGRKMFVQKNISSHKKNGYEEISQPTPLSIALKNIVVYPS